MFCYKCGTKLVDGSSFCHSCGTKMTNISNVEEDVEELEDDDIDVEDKIGTEPYAVTRFYYAFKNGNMYGNKVRFVDEDKITDAMYENGNTYFNYDNESPFLIFDYRNDLENGFIITTSNIIWKYNYSGRNEMYRCCLYDIKEIRMEKAVLANVMRIITKSGEKYKDIYMTGMDNVALFINRFREYISLLQDDSIKINDDLEIIQENGRQNINVVGISEERIAEICASKKDGSLYWEVGNPIHSKKEKNARRYFEIPQDEKIYLIFDSTILGGCQKGIAVCSTGVYFSENGLGYLDWKTFKQVPVSAGKTNIKLANLSFATGIEGKELCEILQTIQAFV